MEVALVVNSHLNRRKEQTGLPSNLARSLAVKCSQVAKKRGSRYTHLSPMRIAKNRVPLEPYARLFLFFFFYLFHFLFHFRERKYFSNVHRKSFTFDQTISFVLKTSRPPKVHEVQNSRLH